LVDVKIDVSLQLAHASIHGFVSLPEGYDLTVVPEFVKVDFHDAEKIKNDYHINKLCCNYNAVKILASIVQTVAGAISVYRGRGMQIKAYGYTAYNLTVIPYMLMSLTNLVANLSCPDYPTLYIVETDLLDEARRNGAVVEGTVGRIHSFMARPRTGLQKCLKPILYVVGIGLIALPFVAVGLLTGFKAGPKSQPYERGWLISWLITSIIFGVPLGILEKNTYFHSLKLLYLRNKSIADIKASPEAEFIEKVVYNSLKGLVCVVVTVCKLLAWVIVFVTPIGMFVSVGRQIMSFGICKTV
jgi:hypothetical protein